MKLIRYSALLLGLLFITLVLFVWTSEGSYTESENLSVNVPKAFVYDYIQNLENWQDFLKDTSGKSYTLQQQDSIWTADGSSCESALKKVSVASYSNTNQVYNWEWFGHETTCDFQLEEDDLKTNILITWTGSLSFWNKGKSLLGLAVLEEQKTTMKKNLLRLKERIIVEYMTHSIESPVVTHIMEQYYLNKKLTLTLDQFLTDVDGYSKEFSKFITSNQLELVTPFGMEFISNQPDTYISLVGWMKDEIYTSAESEIISGVAQELHYLKVRFKGNHHHWPAALQKGREYLKSNNAGEMDPEQRLRLEFVVKSPEERQPSQWVSDLYIPLKKKTTTTPPTD
jgi:effector-binding domain-containing protein